MLPERRPVLWNMASKCFETLAENPYAPGELLFPVAAFNSPGYVLTGVSAYEETPASSFLPLFSYGAVGWHGKGFRSTVLQVDREKRQDLRLMKPADVVRGIRHKQKTLPRQPPASPPGKVRPDLWLSSGQKFFSWDATRRPCPPPKTAMRGV